MKPIIRSLGPPVAMLCAVAMLCWNHLSPQTQLEPLVAKTLRLNPKRLTPELPHRAERNLFARIEKQPKTRVAESPAEVVSESESIQLVSQRRLASDAAGLVLRGAMLGRRPQAIINEQIVVVGDQLAVGRSSLVVQEIRADAVLLSSEFGAVWLTYNRPADVRVAPSMPPQRPLSSTDDRGGRAHDAFTTPSLDSVFSPPARWLRQLSGVVLSSVLKSLPGCESTIAKQVKCVVPGWEVFQPPAASQQDPRIQPSRQP